MGRYTVHLRSFAYNFIQAKVKVVCLTEWTLYLEKIFFPPKNSIVRLLNLAVFNIQHLKLDREELFAYIFFLSIKLQERLILSQLVPINKSNLKFRHSKL